MTDVTTGSRALVLGGGGIAGIAWESGLLVGLKNAGIDLADADLVVGTSAGSVVGAALRENDIGAWFRAQLEPVDEAKIEAAMGGMDLEPFLAAIAAAAESTADERETRAKLGDLALAHTDPQSEAASVARIGTLLASTAWPRGFRVTAVDARNGDFTVFDSNSGVDLVRAIAASCAVPGVYSTVTIDGRQFMDGGMRSATNADVTVGSGRVIVVACSPEAPMSPLGTTLPQAVDALRKSAEVLVIEADAASQRAFGANSLLLSSRAASAEAGLRQAAEVADDVRRFWG